MQWQFTYVFLYVIGEESIDVGEPVEPIMIASREVSEWM